MKIAFFSSGLAYRLGGPAYSESLLVCELRKSIQVDIYVPQESFEREFAEDYGLGEVCTYRTNETSKLFSNLKTADLIHLNGHWKWWYSNLSKLSIQNRIPYVLHPRGMLLVGHRKKQAKRVFNFAMGDAIVKNASKVIALSEYEKRQFAPYRIPDENIVVIPNPIVVGETAQRPKPNLPLGVDEYFLYLGRIERRKNLVFLVKAYKKYRDLGGQLGLLIMGPVERAYDLEVREAVLNEGLDQDVLILPPAYESERDKFLQHSKALIYPATDEPFGRVPFEALAVGTVPVVPDLSGAAEYLAPFLPDCVYNENDSTDLAKTLIKVESIQQERIEDARNWIANHFSPSEIAKQVLKVYSTVLQRSVASSIYGNLSPGSFPESTTD